MKKPFTILVAVCVFAAFIFAGPSRRGSSLSSGDAPGAKNIHEAMAVYEVRHKNIKPVEITVDPNKRAVQLCLLLDTSNSMDGLINQAKSQLWMIVNDLAKTHKENKDIQFQVALYEYGNDGLPVTNQYIRKVSPFTSDLDFISEKLFSLKTNGGSEYCGHVIASSLNQLQWNPSPEALKILYIAGNEPFTQGDVNFRVPCKIAAKRNVVVNTIHCGDHNAGVREMWQEGARLGGGHYFSIDSDKQTRGIVTPYDEKLIKYNDEINSTYLRYGSRGQANYQRQQSLDVESKKISRSNLASRAQSKGSRLYNNRSWDLVDAAETEDFDIAKVDKNTLPKDLQGKSEKELKDAIAEKKKRRTEIQKEIADLAKKRDAFIRKKQAELGEDNSLGSAILKSVQDQAKKKNFEYKK